MGGQPNLAIERTGKTIAVIGSDQLVWAADQLNKAGHSVTIYERHKLREDR